MVYFDAIEVLTALFGHAILPHRRSPIVSGKRRGKVSEVPSSSDGDPRARLLVVDDEANLRTGLRDLLGLMGYYVEEAASGHEALGMLESASYDLMVLDIRMPGIDGVEVMHRARRMYPDLPIIVLTAHASLESAIAAVKTGAADYMLKPFNIEDLEATISQALKEYAEQQRHQQLLDLIGSALDTLGQAEGHTVSPAPSSDRSDRFLHVASLTLDRHKRLVVMQGDPPETVELTEGEAAILAAMMQRPNQVLSCSELVEAAMGYTLEEQEAQNQVRLYVFRLRRKIEADPADPRLICTVRGSGYFLSPN